MKEWFNVWNVELTDYSKTGVCVSAAEHSVLINQKSDFSAIKVRFNNKNQKASVKYEKAWIVFSDGKEVPLTVNGNREILIEGGACLYSDEIKIVSVGAFKIYFKTSGMQISDAALIPSTDFSEISDNGTFSTSIEAYKSVLDSVEDQYKWHYGIDEVLIYREERVQKKKVLFLGDSNFHRSYIVDAFRKLKKNTECINRGINGNRLLSDTILPFIGNINGKAALKRIEEEKVFYDEIYILIGINDILLPFEYGILKEAVSFEALKDGFESLLEKAGKLCSDKSKIKILTLLPFKGHKAWNGITENVRDQINQWIKTQNHIDAASLIADKNDLQKIAAEFAEDSLHVNKKGGEKIAVLIATHNAD